MPSAIVIIVSAAISLLAFALIIVAFTDKKLRGYSFIFNIIFTLILSLDNIFRFIPASKNDNQGDQNINLKDNPLCVIQAFFLSLLDKLMFTLMTSFSFISYKVLCNSEDYKNKNKERKLYFYLYFISFIISLLCTIIFTTQGYSNRSEFCYVETKSLFKQWIDSILTIILFIINIFCFAKILKELKEKKKQNEINSYEYKRFIIGLFINISIFINVFLLIIKSMPFEGQAKDILYVVLSLFVDLYIIFNYELKNYIQKCCCCENQPEKQPQENKDEKLIPTEENAQY